MPPVASNAFRPRLSLPIQYNLTGSTEDLPWPTPYAFAALLLTRR